MMIPRKNYFKMLMQQQQQQQQMQQQQLMLSQYQQPNQFVDVQSSNSDNGLQYRIVNLKFRVEPQLGS
jgi:hypothetical protein